MPDIAFPVAVLALDVAPRATLSIHPEPFASRIRGREKRPLGDAHRDGTPYG